MNFKINWDTLGIATSLACAIHCALLPLIFTSLPVFGINVIENLAFEIFMVVLAFAIGIYSLYHGYNKHHHNLLPIIIFTAGVLSLVLKLFFIEYENWLLIPAITGIITAHLINYRLCRIHDHAHADDCAH
ncbi:MAG: MerC domain-containing protein [Segetibacter sp.]|jgi:uncharacterized membrane protein|nr:MerC domain-containing protein [Segetibacter sp.]